jgi:hypothetical protein
VIVCHLERVHHELSSLPKCHFSAVMHFLCAMLMLLGSAETVQLVDNGLHILVSTC